MNGTEVRQVAPIENTPIPRELHGQYADFMHELGKERSQEEFPCLDYEELTAWLRRLDPVTRQICESDFREGYSTVVKEGEKQVAEAIAKCEEEAKASRSPEPRPGTG